MSDAALDAMTVHRMVEELQAMRGPLEIVFQPASALTLAGVVQLALRHPELGAGANRAAAERFLEGVRAYFADCPTVLDVLRRGDDPAEDR